MSSRSYIKRVVPEAILLLLIGGMLVEYRQFINAPIRTDILYGSDFTYQIVTGTSLLEVRDPWFRYIPQVVVLETISIFRPITNSTALSVYRAYTVFLEGFLLPGMLYVYTRWRASRTAALLSLVGILLIQPDLFSLVPEFPQEVLTIPPAARWQIFESKLTGKTWYFTVLWHYVFALPFILGSLGVLATKDETKWAVLAGVLLGLAGSIQVIQALVAAMTITVGLLWTKRHWELTLTAGSSIVIAMPNIPIILRYTEAWFHQGQNRMATTETNVLFLGITIILTILAIFLYWRLQTDTDTEGGHFTKFEVTSILVPFLLMIWLIPLSAGWYRTLVASVFRYPAMYVVGVLVAPPVHTRLSALQLPSWLYE